MSKKNKLNKILLIFLFVLSIIITFSFLTFWLIFKTLRTTYSSPIQYFSEFETALPIIGGIIFFIWLLDLIINKKILWRSIFLLICNAFSLILIYYVPEISVKFTTSLVILVFILYLVFFVFSALIFLPLFFKKGFKYFDLKKYKIIKKR